VNHDSAKLEPVAALPGKLHHVNPTVTEALSACKWLFNKYAYRKVLERHAARLVVLDPIWTGGIADAVKIASLADTCHLGIATHGCSGLISLFAALHFCTAVPNAAAMETVRGFCEGYYLELVARPLPIRAGRLLCESTPGLGVGLRPEVLARSDIEGRVTAK
jgi:L-alanine-DL-glutamate epimerase-like enolase superfamily enzyme